MLQFKLNNILTISILIILFLTTGCDDEESGFGDWDSNDNDLIERNEFNQGITDDYYFSDWDSDSDGVLTEEEWNDGIGTWDDYDGDLEFSDWDSNYDNEISEDEFNDGFFNTIDDDDNDTIDEDEWSVFY